jgi:hypothetical protein
MWHTLNTLSTFAHARQMPYYQLALRDFTPHALEQNSRAALVRMTWTWTDDSRSIYLHFRQRLLRWLQLSYFCLRLSADTGEVIRWVRNRSPLRRNRGSVGKVVCLLPTQLVPEHTPVQLEVNDLKSGATQSHVAHTSQNQNEEEIRENAMKMYYSFMEHVTVQFRR